MAQVVNLGRWGPMHHNAVDDLGRTPLHLATEAGMRGGVELLLSQRASPHVADGEGVTPLMVAARSLRLDLMRTIVAAAEGSFEMGGSSRCGDESSRASSCRVPSLDSAALDSAALDSAAVESAAVESAAAAGEASAASAGPLGRLVTGTASAVGGPRAESAIGAGVPLMSPTPLSPATPMSDMASPVKEGGVPVVCARDALGRDALHMAVRAGRKRDCLDVVTWLILKGASVTDSDLQGNTPLHLGCTSTHSKAEAVLKRLLDAKADLGSRNSQQQTALHVCAAHGAEKVALQLLIRDDATGTQATLDARDINGDTPLHLSVKAGQAKLTQLFVQAGMPHACVCPPCAGGYAPCMHFPTVSATGCDWLRLIATDCD